MTILLALCIKFIPEFIGQKAPDTSYMFLIIAGILTMLPIIL